MQELVSAAWKAVGPRVRHHVGGLAWSRYHVPDSESDWTIRIWEEDGRAAAWAWLSHPGTLEFEFHPDRRGLLDAILAWFEAEASGADELVAWATLEDSDTTATLKQHGYRRPGADAPRFLHLVPELDEIPESSIPEGFTLRTVRADDLERRVAVHRAAWHPSRVTTRSHLDVIAAYPYRPELDCVVEATAGSLTSYCLAWLDPETGVGELEPIGTDPRFARRGLGAAGCLFALRQLQELGATREIAYARGDPGYPAPRRLYESLGFRASATSVGFRLTR